MTIDGPIITLIAFGIILLILCISLVRLHGKLQRFMRGKDAQSLEETFLQTLREMERIEEAFAAHTARIETLEGKAARSLQGVSTVRFNPFKNAGGSQSFATAFANERGDGTIISTLYGRERVSMFAKPIRQWKSDFELTPEEERALAEARSYQQR